MNHKAKRRGAGGGGGGGCAQSKNVTFLPQKRHKKK